MKQHKALKKLHDIASRRILPTLALTLAAMILTGISATPRANALYILTNPENTTVILEDTEQIPALSSPLVDVSSNSHCADIKITENQTVTIHYDGAVMAVQSQGETISALLHRLHIVPSRLDMVAVDLSGDNVVLTIGQDITYYETVTEEVSYRTVRVPNAELEAGVEQVIQTGINGVRTSVYEVVWSHGELVSRQFVEELESTTVDEIIEYGTAEASSNQTLQSKITNVSKNADGSGVLTLANGDTLTFSAVKHMTATAYTAGHGGVGTRTASGTQVHIGTVAVDKSVIPLGTKMYIVANDGSYVYGLSTAEDIGVRGNKVDLYMNTYHDCITFGRRTVSVYILE